MSVELHEEAAGKVLGIKLTGKLTKEDYEKFVPEVDRLVKEQGKLRLLVELHDFHGWTAGALWEDLKFDFHHSRDIERLAIVGENAWEQGMASFCKPFTSANIRYFDKSKADEARTWTLEGLATA
jgi:hypothetical protein